MARFFHTLGAVRPLRLMGMLGVWTLGSSWLQAATPAPSTNAAPANAGAPMATASAQGGNKMMANAAGAVVVPPEDTFNRYGKILAPGSEPAHPLKLELPFPGVGEIKVPTPDELTMREKLEQLATLSDQDIRTKLDQWPPFKTMSLKDEGMMLGRIQDFRDRRSKIATDRAHAMGLTLTPAQQAKFEKDYWDKRLPMERDLAKQFEPILRDREMKLEEQLFREFSTPGAQLAQAVKPWTPAPALPQNKPAASAPAVPSKPAQTPAPVVITPIKATPTPPVSATTNAAQAKPMD